MIGRTIGSYEVRALIGSGGMGSVWRGLDVMLDRPVAIKALRADIASNPEAVERFRQEARILARFLHPHIATLYALLPDGDDLFMVMEYVEGETFEELLRRQRRLPPAQAVPLLGQALSGIEQAHHHGVIHRDIKPANLILTPGGTVKVMDFGIARLRGSQRMTRTHFTIGTAAYMAPEQVRSHDLDARADVYALGILLYELLTGRVPFQSASTFEVMQAHLQTPPPPPSTFAELPPELEQIVLRALEKSPDDRFPSAAALHDALHALALPEPSLDLRRPTVPETPVPQTPVPAEPSEPAAVPPQPPQGEDETVLATPSAPRDRPRELDETVLLSAYTPAAGTDAKETIAPRTPPQTAADPTPERDLRPLALAAAVLLVLAIGLALLSQRSVRSLDAEDLAEQTAEPETEVAAPLLPPGSAEPQVTPPVEDRAPASPSPKRATTPPTQQQPEAERPPPAPSTGTVRILVRPFGDVYVDGRRLATGTNAAVLATLPVGTHRVRAVHPVLGSLERRVTVEGGRTREVLLEFDTAASADPVSVTVVSDPVNAEIFIDGDRTGRYTPATVRLPPGRHAVELRLPGYASARQTVTVAVGRSERVRFTLTRQ